MTVLQRLESNVPHGWRIDTNPTVDGTHDHYITLTSMRTMNQVSCSLYGAGAIIELIHSSSESNTNDMSRTKRTVKEVTNVFNRSSSEGILVGERLRLARASLGLTQKGMADALGISKRQWIRFEQGEVVVSEKVLLRISDLTGEPKNWFIHGIRESVGIIPDVDGMDSISILPVGGFIVATIVDRDGEVHTRKIASI